MFRGRWTAKIWEPHVTSRMSISLARSFSGRWLLGKFPQKCHCSVSVLSGPDFIYSEASSRVPGTATRPCSGYKAHLRSHRGPLALPEGCERAARVKRNLAHAVYPYSSFCWVRVCLAAREREGLVFIRGHQRYLVAEDHRSSEHAEGGSRKTFWNPKAGVLRCDEWHSWKDEIFSNTAASP